MIDELIQYKKDHFPDDGRRILTCGIPDGKIRVEWLKAAAPGIDSQWEMRLYGLVKTGARQQAIRFLQETRGVSHKEAAKRVAGIAAELGACSSYLLCTRDQQSVDAVIFQVSTERGGRSVSTNVSKAARRSTRRLLLTPGRGRRVQPAAAPSLPGPSRPL